VAKQAADGVVSVEEVVKRQLILSQKTCNKSSEDKAIGVRRNRAAIRCYAMSRELT